MDGLSMKSHYTGTPVSTPCPSGESTFTANKAASVLNDADNDPDLKKIHAEILDLESRKSSLDFIMKKPREQWSESYSIGAPALYEQVRNGVTAKEHSTAFRITAFTWIAGSVCAFGAVAAAFMGGAATNVLGAVFVGSLGVGTGAGRLYKWAANKWIIPKKIDKVLSELIPKQHAILEHQLEIDRKLEEQAIQRYVTRQGENASTGSTATPPTVQEVDDDIIDVAGIKLKINQQSGLVQSIPLSKWGRALYRNS